TGGGNTGDETGGIGRTGSGSTEMNLRTEFVRDAADGGMMEVQLGNLAIQKASSQSVKDFARMMVDDHSKANDELKDLATTDNITIPSSVSEDHQDDITKLSKLSGTEFDKEYMDLMVKDHQKDVDKFEDASKNVSDPALKSWIDKTLPTLRHHLDMAKSTRDQIKNNQ
ncbi:MAG: DUF4142 domain-containing protein, partial [Bacillota bacterium]